MTRNLIIVAAIMFSSTGLWAAESAHKSTPVQVRTQSDKPAIVWQSDLAASLEAAKNAKKRVMLILSCRT